MSDFEGKTALTTTSEHAELRYAQSHSIPWAAPARHKEAHQHSTAAVQSGPQTNKCKNKKKKTKWNQRMINAFLCSPWIIYHSQDDASVVLWYEEMVLHAHADRGSNRRRKKRILFYGLLMVRWDFVVAAAACIGISHVAYLWLWQRGPTRVIVTSTAAAKDFLANWRPTKCARRIILCVILWQLFPSYEETRTAREEKKRHRTI